MSALFDRLKEYLVNPPIAADDLEREIIFFSEYDTWEYTVMDQLGEFRGKVVGVCKNEPKGPIDFLNSKYFRRINTVSPAFVIEKCPDSILLVTIWDKEINDKIKAEFKGYGVPFVTDIHGYTFSHACAGKILPAAELTYLSEAYDFFSGEDDRRIILDKALYVIGAKSETPFTLPQYFVPCMTFSADEIVADCGFYTGDTAEKYIKYAGDFKRYYGFEPSEQNISKVPENIAADPRIEIIKAGVHSYNTTLRFSYKIHTASASAFDDLGGESLPVVSLDAFFDGKEPPTFIKMDIEGSEIAALLGAKCLIREYKPKLAICIYHKPEDIIEIPILIRELNPDYEMKLYCHTDIGADIVIYCW
jgi:FkbM family methyltransferase